MISLRFVLALAVALLVPGGRAATFIAADAIDVATILPPPPADDSPAGLADLETVLQLQADRTSGQLERVVRVARQTVFTFAAPVLGEWFTAANLPRTAAVFATVTAESYAVALQTKKLWTRPRPHLRDARIEPVPNRSRSAAYPSGHASDAATWAVLLAELFPAHREAFQRQVHEAMWCRVLGGSHYPSDTAAGKLLGEIIGRKILETPATRAALEEIRAEMAPFMTRPVTPSA